MVISFNYKWNIAPFAIQAASDSARLVRFVANHSCVIVQFGFPTTTNAAQ